MSDSDRVQYKFMIPVELKARLEEAAHEGRRSLSAEIIARLESTLPPPSDETDPFSVDAIEAEFARLLGRTLDRVRKAESSPRRKPKKP